MLVSRTLPRRRGNPARGLSTSLDVGAELCELRLEILVAAVDEAHTVHAGRPLSGERSDQVAEAGAQVGNDEFGGVQLARSGDHRRMAEVAATEAARRPAEALPVRLNGRAHLVERLRVT